MSVIPPPKGKGKDSWSLGGGGKGYSDKGSSFGGGGKGWGMCKGKDKGKGKGMCKGKDKGKGKGKRRGPSGPTLPRERITQEPVTGEVQEWKGKYGWIKPTVPVEHPTAARRNGNIYVSMSDLVGGITALTPGSLCQFHIFTDPSGLGAEECLGS
eukprot:CAMPEP_0115764444 /NCGR_PEP_ID=MMETSP0272-20121206/102060_1 /TAXON_ID=71861 /ORGANISM="Scrippsiella trochoidea, Strain CCMP3099" /LENGTH=154 /DNA_ID=CAMNT_0003210225 /DNA_START=44 /DNA_END=508 /DNA_ORIENTATION=-